MSPQSTPDKLFRESATVNVRQGLKLVDAVIAACRRLANGGWAEMLAAHGLNILVADLANELIRELGTIDRSQPGFEDFALEGKRGIEPGIPSRSLLFHAFASPAVSQFRKGQELISLTTFPTVAEIEFIENYVFGASPPSIEDLRARVEGAPLAIVVFASDYRTGAETVHRRHADMCYARTGVARIGSHKANYVQAARGFSPIVVEDVHAMAVLPCRYSAYVAALKPGSKAEHGPLQFVERRQPMGAGGVRPVPTAGLPAPSSALNVRVQSDAERQFWLPLHKLFDGKECIRGYDIAVRLASQHVNEKIRRAHLFFGANGHDGGWHEDDISKYPFVIKSGIAEFSSAAEDGSWLLSPTVHRRLIEPAEFNGEPLTYIVPKTTPDSRWRTYQSSLNLQPASSGARAAPEYLHARHAVNSDGEENLNEQPDVIERVRCGGYRARHYVDFTGDGWIDVECGALAMEIPRRLPAFSIVATPHFFPFVSQAELIRWTDQSAPPALLANLWPTNPGRPEPLSSQRYAANLQLHEAGFEAHDDTMTAIVGACGSGRGMQMELRPAVSARTSMLPDGAAGVFAPGWDVSYDRTSEASPDDSAGSVDPGVTFLTNYGLGSPFPEDSMLCAALSSFWPAAAPDITRTFAPSPKYATATPLLDAIIGIGGSTPWDGIRGPVPGPSVNTVDYKLLAYGDYVEAALARRFDLSLISGTSVSEYIARTLTMAMVYETLMIIEPSDKVKWSVLSFRKAAPEDPDLLNAMAAHRRRLDAQYTYRYEMIRHDGVQARHPDPARFDRVIVTFTERVLLFADPTIVIRRSSDGTWARPYERTR